MINQLLWYACAASALLCFFGGIGFSFLSDYYKKKLELLLESKGVPYRPEPSSRPGIRTRAYEADLFIAWCRYVLPDEPLIERLLFIGKVQKYCAVSW
ncbi:MAG: hypothetical protein ACK5UT_11245, partial [Acidobacteriota bacterium]